MLASSVWTHPPCTNSNLPSRASLICQDIKTYTRSFVWGYFLWKVFDGAKRFFEEALTFSCPLWYQLPALPTTVWRMKPEQRERLGDYSLEKKHVFSKAVKYIYSEANWNTPPHKCIWNHGAPWQICTATTECIWLYSRNTLYRSPTNLRKIVVLSKKEEIQNFKTKFEVGVIGKSTSL